MPYLAISIVALAIIAGGLVFFLRKRRPETEKPNKPMFWIGIAIVAIALIFFLTEKGEMENKMWAIPIWMMGIGLIATSRYRLIK
jgi:amino acid transporter